LYKPVSKFEGTGRRRAWDTVAAFDVIFIDTGEVCGGRKYYFMARTYYVVAAVPEERSNSCGHIVHLFIAARDAAWHKERARQ
jgi:hypothetical protein